MTGCPCGPGWRVEAAALGSGTIMASLPVVSFDCQNLLNKTGTGTFVLRPGDITNLRHVWPDMTSIWVTYYGQFVWAGYVRSLSLQAGTLSLGCNSLDDYLNRRTIRRTLTYTNTDQNKLAAVLVEYQRRNHGINMFGVGVTSQQRRDRTYFDYDRTNLGEAVSNLTQVENGPDWRMTATRLPAGQWVATMTFADYWGVVKETTLVSNVQATDYGLDINSDNHATVVDAIGSGSEADQLMSTAAEFPYPGGTSPYVEFDAAPAFKDTIVKSTLDQQAAGYLDLNREPWVNPRFFLSGRENTQGLGVLVGDTVQLRMCFDGLGYTGSSRIIGDTWHAAPDAATTRELLFDPNDRPSMSLLDQPPCETFC